MVETRSILVPSEASPEHLSIPRCARSELRPLVGEAGYEEMEATLARARELLGGRKIWHVTASALGGMAEVLRALLCYVRDAGIDAHWAVLHANGDFRPIAQRLYNGLYGSPSSGLELGEDERRTYERVLGQSAAELGEVVREGDVVILHDPPTAGLIEPMREAGAHVVWRCHLGVDDHDPTAEATQRFLAPYVEPAGAYVFSRRQFVWPQLEGARTWIVPPSINPLSPKNQRLDPPTVTAILDRIGLTAEGGEAQAALTRLDGSPFRVDSTAVVEQRRPIPPSAPVVAQLSSWDRLKDPGGLIECFAGRGAGDAHLIVAGPDPATAAEESDSETVWRELVEQVRGLAPEVAERIHLAALPTARVTENAAMVNAIQTRAAIVVRKSFSEGFGLSLAEGMWKGTPAVATRVGGIQDLVIDGETGLLVDDPRDLDGFAAAIGRLLTDPGLAARLGAAARERVRGRYLISRHLTDYLRVAISLIEDSR